MNDAQFEAEIRRGQSDKDRFLERSAAVSVPIELYTLWLKILHQQDPQAFRSQVTFRDYRFETSRMLMPTRHTPDTRIPAGYGAMSMELMLLGPCVEYASVHARSDWRKGWEWGHTTVYSLRKDADMFVAKTNNDHSITVYSDVQPLLTLPIQTLLERLRGHRLPMRDLAALVR
jgi:hypothetical protein